jgi:hypothetical protein
LFRARLLQEASIDPVRVRQLIIDLDADSYETRQRGERELDRLGVKAASAVEIALNGKPSLEVYYRLKRLLVRIDREILRQVRVVESLERMGTPEARQLLVELATGPPSTLTREAVRSLRRLAAGAAPQR